MGFATLDHTVCSSDFFLLENTNTYGLELLKHWVHGFKSCTRHGFMSGFFSLHCPVKVRQLVMANPASWMESYS